MWIFQFNRRTYCVFFNLLLLKTKAITQINYYNKVSVDLEPGEEIVDIASGQSHNILLTSNFFFEIS